MLKELAAGALALPPVARRAALTVSAIGLAYPRPDGAHPLVGRRAPDLQLSGGTRLAEVLRDGAFVLVTRRPADAEESAHLRIVEPARPLASTVLVRPDGYVAWAADDPTPAQVRDVLQEWCVSS